MKLTISQHEGPNTYAFGAIMVEGKTYDITVAHFWQKAEWRVRDREDKEIGFTCVRDNLVMKITDFQEEDIGRILSESYRSIEMIILGRSYSLQAERQRGVISTNELWNCSSRGEHLGEITYKEPITRLSADLAVDDARIAILACAALWMNRQKHLSDG